MRRLMYSPPHDTRPTVRYTDLTEATSVGALRVPVCPKSSRKSCYHGLPGTSQSDGGPPDLPETGGAAVFHELGEALCTTRRRIV
jgi:hypothetical protein